MIAEPEARGFCLGDAGHVANGACLDQSRDDRGSERAGTAGNDDMTIAKIHA
jgi:hypothetical protein